MKIDEIPEIDIDVYLGKLRNKNIVPFELNECILNEENIFEIHEFNLFCNFLSIEEIKTVFFQKFYYNHEAFLITEEKLKGQPGFIKREARNKMDELNSENKVILKNMDERLGGIRFICSFQGSIVVSKVIDEMYSRLKTGDKLVEDIASSISKDSEDEIKQQIQLDLENLKQQILSDPEFRKSTNTTLRKQYASKISKKYPNAKRIVLENELRGSIMVALVEPLWKEYKESTKST